MSNVVITIVAVDKSSSVIKAISHAARKAGDDLRKAGADGKKGMKDIEEGAKGADSRMRTVERTSLSLGAALGGLALGVIKASAAWKAQERQVDAVNRLYGDSSRSLLEYAETIQLTTRYSNDAARESLVLLNTLTQNYGYSQDQIESLLSRATDLAQLHGRTLTEVTQMISNALRGEGEYIEQIGVTLNQTFVAAEAAARGMGNFISEMSAAEQAAFRYTLLLEQTAAAQGYAMESATGATGAVALLMNMAQDAGQAFGDFIGPVAEVAAQFNAYALWLPLIFSQFGRVSSTLLNASGRATLAAGSMRALGFAMSPLGLIIGGVAIAAGVLGAKWLEESQAQAQAAAQAEQTAATYRSLADTIANLNLAGSTDLAQWASDQLNFSRNFITDWNKTIADGLAAEDEGWFEGWVDNLSNSLSSAFDVLGPNFQDASNFLADMGDNLSKDALAALTIDPQTEQAFNNSLNRIFSLLSNPNIDIDSFQSEFAAFWEQLWIDVANGVDNGGIAVDQIDEELNKFYDRIALQIGETEDLFADAQFQFELDDMRIKGLDEVADDVEEFADLVDRIINVRSDYANAMLQVNPDADTSFLKNLELTHNQATIVESSLKRIGDLVKSGDFDNAEINLMLEDLLRLFQLGKIDAATFTAAIYDMAASMSEFKIGAESAEFAAKAMEERLKGLTGAATEAANEIREAFSENMAGFIDSYLEAFNMNDPVSLLNLSSLRNEFTALAGDIANASSQMETVFRVIVGNTDAIKSQAQSIHDWIDGLADVEEGVRRIDALLADGLINQGQYDAAIQAHDDIANAQIRIANNIDAIQAKQAPFIAQFVEQQAVALEALNGQSEAQQRITLGWMDAATAGQAYQLIQQAVAVGNGELGRSGELAFEQMIRGAIAVNPFLFDMLETIGLISGTPLDFEVNFDGVTEGMSEIEMLTLRIEDLVRALDGTLTPIDIEVNGEEEVASAEESIRELIGGGARDLAIKIKTTLTDDSGSPLGALGGGLSSLAKRLLGGDGGGDGTGGAVNIPVKFDYPEPKTDFAAFDEVEIPVTYDVQEADLQDQFDDVVIKVTYEADATGLAASILTYSGQRIDGPTFVFQFDDGALFDTIGSYGNHTEDGPSFAFRAETIDATNTALTFAGGSYDGPTFNFLAVAEDALAGATTFSDSTYYGPEFIFQPDSGVVTGRASLIAGSTYEGPTFNFQANTRAVTDAIGRYAGRTVGTAYINVEARMVGNIPGTRHGGVPHRAGGGILTYLAEDNNPETLHFANGGSTVIRDEGLYSVPPSTLVVPSNNDRSPGSGVTVVLNTGDFYGGSRPDLDEWASDTLVPAISSELRRMYSSAGS